MLCIRNLKKIVSYRPDHCTVCTQAFIVQRQNNLAGSLIEYKAVLEDLLKNRAFMNMYSY